MARYFRLTLILCLSIGLTPTVMAQTFTILHAFHGKPDGTYPHGGLVMDKSGNLYGITFSGTDSFSEGAIYKIDPIGRTTLLHHMTYRNGCGSTASLLLDEDGNLYGTTGYCGAYREGTAFVLEPSGKYVTLHSFGSGESGQPLAGLIRDDAGNLYGVASAFGEVFELDHRTGAETILYRFKVAPDGFAPSAPLLRDSDGNLYGTTTLGGVNDENGYGIVFKLDPSGNETILYTFTGGTDGGNPVSSLVRDEQGNLYGTTLGGGLDYGIVFKLDPTGNLTVLHSFTSFVGDGAVPFSGLIRDHSGNFYGTTQYGGQYGFGTVYEMDALGNVTVLHSFTGGADGQEPFDNLIMDDKGTLYGTASMGGDPGCGCGVAFSLKP